MSLALALAVVAILSFGAFWKLNVVIFQVTAGASMVLGLTWFDVYTTDLGLGISLMLILYSFVCLGFGYRCLFWQEYKVEV